MNTESRKYWAYVDRDILAQKWIVLLGFTSNGQRYVVQPIQPSVAAHEEGAAMLPTFEVPNEVDFKSLLEELYNQVKGTSRTELEQLVQSKDAEIKTLKDHVSNLQSLLGIGTPGCVRTLSVDVK